MKKSSIYGAGLACSVAVNLFFLVNLYVGASRKQPGWSQRAAAEAEVVAGVSCSGHGRAFLDGPVVDGKHVCECNSCYGGPDCSLFLPECLANADGGDPLFLEPFWVQHAASSAVLVSGWHRMSYSFGDLSTISSELEKLIRRVHAIAKNAVTEGRHIVFGVGSTQLLSAAVYALSPENSSSPARVVAAAPYYPLYEIQTEYFRSVDFRFEGDANLWKNSSDMAAANVIEFVTSPNNPDCQLNKAVLQGPLVKTIHDHAYYWPHFTAIPAPADEDLMIFTTSKLTGHAGSRLGWAVIKDEAVYQRMLQYIETSELGVSRDTQLRALKLLKAVLEGDGREIFEFAYRKMSTRWEKLRRALSTSTRFSLQPTAPQYCTFFQEVRGPSPAYAWLKCEREEEDDCSAVLHAANILGREGKKYGVENRHTRLSLLRSQDDFDLLLSRLTNLVSGEDGAKSSM
ncbi:tryptophan aminotransferase-related protein 4-like [Diospyros lotus]|uniref:tryptophan aminotransferase-related protein 4-like n=1 Tax=Diospyros lotus TaxID=55363 RepID=UPI002253C39F|nr:tryptophan aminotransferase-related protein 4-like [Diospyros lotus]